MALEGQISSVPTSREKAKKLVRFQVRCTQFGTVSAGELHLKEPVIANENDVVVCSRIEFVGGIRGEVRVSIRVESRQDEQTVSNASCLSTLGLLTATYTNP